MRQLYEDAGVCCMFARMYFVFAVNITCKCVYTVSTDGCTAVLAVMFVAAVKKGISYSQCLILFQPIVMTVASLHLRILQLFPASSA